MSDDYEKLLADVERSLGGDAAPSKKVARGGASAVPSRADTAPSRGDAAPAPRGRLAANARTAVVAGAVAAGVIYVLFAFTPFLRAGSGAWGAFLATTIAVFLTSYLRRS